jgi:hypothetical protein
VEPTLQEMAASPYVELSSAVATSPSGFGAAATTRTVTSTNSYKSLVGLTVVKHYGYTTWTYSGGTMYSSPRAVTGSYWTAPLNYNNGLGSSWDWYTTGSGGTARANHWAKFTFGVPTPWGPVGSTLLSRILLNVDGWGSYWRS